MLAEVPAALCGATQKLKVPGSNMRSPSEVTTLSRSEVTLNVTMRSSPGFKVIR